jgi:DNA helicase-2/ATP-dependent DNA helicase PcrA
VSHLVATVLPVPDPLLDDLDARQREAVTSPARPLAVVAPAGSGKTRVLTRRIAYRVREGDASARHVLAVTFTRKAAGELGERLARLGVRDGVAAGTFHALALAQLRRRASEQGREPPTVLASKARLLAPLVGARDVADVAAEIEWAKARMVTADAFAAAAAAAGRRLPRPAAEVARVYARYEQAKRARRLCDFDDLLWWCADAIERDEEFAAAQRWRFRHLFVDEFQDATPLQVRLVRAWVGDRDDLFVVGDAAQAVYGFAGADASPLADFATRFAGGTVVTLDRNYRSTRAVVAVAEAALAGPGSTPRAPVVAVREGGEAPVLRAFDDETAEAAGVVQGLWRAYTDGVPWSRMAVLFRTNAQSAAFEAACTRRGVPCRVTGERRFVDRPAVRALVAELRAIERAAPGRPFTDHLADLAAGAGAERDAGTPGDAAIAGGDDHAGPGAGDDDRAHRDALTRLGREYLAADGGPGSLAGFLAWLDLATRGDDTGAPGVDLATFHRAKGLEWQVVFVTGLERGLVPVSWAARPEDLDEERRLLHVALSRAADSLCCTWARARTVGGRRVRREPSPWWERLGTVAAGHATPAPDPVAQLAGIRATLRDARPPAPRRRRR